MKILVSCIAFLMLVMNIACVEQHERAVIYSPSKAGLLLQFEGFEVDSGLPSQNRLQLWVKETRQTPEGLEVECAATTYRGTGDVVSLCHLDGAVYVVLPDGNKTMVLPPGFPDKTASWQSEGINYHIIGRAKANISGVRPPDHIGVWVEAVPISNQASVLGFDKARFLFLPGIGEAQTVVFWNGKWATINRLVGCDYANVS